MRRETVCLVLLVVCFLTPLGEASPKYDPLMTFVILPDQVGCGSWEVEGTQTVSSSDFMLSPVPTAPTVTEMPVTGTLKKSVLVEGGRSTTEKVIFSVHRDVIDDSFKTMTYLYLETPRKQETESWFLTKNLVNSKSYLYYQVYNSTNCHKWQDRQFMACGEDGWVTSESKSDQKLYQYDTSCVHRQLLKGIETGLYFTIFQSEKGELDYLTFETRRLLPYKDLNITYNLRFTKSAEQLSADENSQNALRIPQSCETVSISVDNFMTDVTKELSHSSREWIIGGTTGVIVCGGLLLWSLLIGSEYWEQCNGERTDVLAQLV